MYVPVKQVTLDYVPEVRQAGQPYWPAFSHLDGELIFEGQRLRIERAKAVWANWAVVALCCAT